MSLHHKILNTRKSRGLTQEELAARANVTVRTIQRIESGETIPRDFTLKSLAIALDISFEELTEKRDVSRPFTAPAQSLEDDRHFLHMLNLSSFAYLMLPFIHFIVPAWLLKNGKHSSTPTIIETGRKMVRIQIYWVVATSLLMLLTMAYNILIARSTNKIYIHYLWPFLIMYFLNAVIIIRNSFRIRNLSN